MTDTSGASFINVVSAYGVDNTGSSDTHALLQTAINSIGGAGNAVYLPSGTYDLGNSQIIIPDDTIVTCSPAAVLRRSQDISGPAPYGSYTSAMVSIGNRCQWSGGVLNNTAVVASSTTQVTIGDGNRTFTVPAGLPWTTSTFLRIWSRANPANRYEGQVISYSGTTLVLSDQFAASGSGTHSDWNITYGGVYQCPMVLHGVTQSIVEKVRVTGNWYVGLLMDGWNPSTGGSIQTSACAFRDCYAESVQNRGIYLYGSCSDNLIDGCYVNGGSGVTDYGVNLNPANASGSINWQLRNKVVGTTVVGSGFQGIAVGDFSVYTIVDHCAASALTNPSGIGFLCQAANAGTPQYNRFSSCVATNCPTAGFYFIGALYGGAADCLSAVCGRGYAIGPSNSIQSQYISLASCEADGCTTGFEVVGSSNRCDLTNIKSIANSGNGVQIDAGASVTLATGRSTANGANLADNGVSSNVGGLLLG